LRRAAIVFAGAVITIGLLSGEPQSPDQSGAYKVGNGVTAPHVISRTDPEYTEEAHANEVEGTVLLSVVIGVDGRAHDVNMVKSLISGLDKGAVDAVFKWRFAPGLKHGVPVKVRAQIEVNFRLI
jgi:TonB family protein